MKDALTEPPLKTTVSPEGVTIPQLLGLKPSRVDAFDLKYTSAPYLTGYWRGNVFNIAQRPEVSQEILNIVLDRAGGLKSIFPASAIEKMKVIHKSWNDLGDQLAAHSFLAVGEIFRAQLPAIDASLIAGKTLPRIQSKSETNETVSATRVRIHALRAELSKEIFLILEPGCLKMQRLAREIVDELDFEENAKANKFKIPYEPSAFLKTIIYFAVCVATGLINNYLFGSSFLAPQDLEKIWQAWIETYPEIINDPRKQGQGMIGLQEQRELSRQRAAAEVETEERERGAKVAELNKMHDAIRTENHPSPKTARHK